MREGATQKRSPFRQPRALAWGLVVSDKYCILQRLGQGTSQFRIPGWINENHEKCAKLLRLKRNGDSQLWQCRWREPRASRHSSLLRYSGAYLPRAALSGGWKLTNAQYNLVSRQLPERQASSQIWTSQSDLCDALRDPAAHTATHRNCRVPRRHITLPRWQCWSIVWIQLLAARPHRQIHGTYFIREWWACC